MKQQIQRIYGLALVVGLLVTLGACGLLDSTSTPLPESSEVSAAQLISGTLPACNPAQLITGDKVFDTLYAITLNKTLDLPQIKVLIPQTGQTVYRKTITSAAGPIIGVYGLAADPLTGTLWAIVRYEDDGGGERSLVTVDPLSGVATLIGKLGDRFSELAFDACGRLFGVTGDGATVSESLFLIDKTDASTTLLMHLGHGDDGEVIAINPYTNALYHASGSFSSFETVNINTGTTTSISLSGDFFRELNSLTFALGGTAFYATNIDGSLYNIATDGLSKLIGAVDNIVYNEKTHGIAFAPGTVPTGDPEAPPAEGGGEGEVESPPSSAAAAFQ